jgi:hypothetical protein
MKSLSKEQAKEWCEERGIQPNTGSGLVSLQYSVSGPQCLQASLALEPPQLVALAHGLLLQDLADPDAHDFSGALVWFREWDIWNEASERAGARMLELVRCGLAGQDVPPLHEAPAHLFTPQEFVDAHVLLTIPALFQWDVFVVPGSARCFAQLSHDAYVRITARNTVILSRIVERFKHGNWNLEECPPE